MELYGEYDTQINPNRRLDVQLEDIAEQMSELAQEDGYSKVCIVVIDNGKQETTKTVYVYVADGEDDE